MGQRRAVTCLSLPLMLAVPWRLAGQCPDGSPPPCGRTAVRAPAPTSVAVLYFDNLSRDTSDVYVADGVTEELITRLGEIERLQVKSRTAVQRYRGRRIDDPAAVGRALNVAHLVSGSVQQGGGRLRVTVELTRAATGVRVWGRSYERPAADLMGVEAEIAQAIAEGIGGRLAPAERHSLAVRQSRNPEAYDHFLRGNFLLALRTPESITRALGEYREAERLDSGFAAAIGRAAYAYAVARSNYLPVPDVPAESVADRGIEVADRALRRDSTSSDAWMARGFLLAYADPHTMAGATEAFERAIALDPRNAEAHHQYAQILNWLGRGDAADRELRVAIALEPGRVVSYDDLAIWTHRRDAALALALTDTAVAFDPTSPRAHWARGFARAFAGNVRGAVEDAEIANRLQPGDPTVEGFLAYAVARVGDSTRARALLAHWPGRAEFSIVAGLVAVGDTAAALERLERAPPEPAGWALLQRPELDPLRGNPRFERLLAARRPQGATGP